MILESVFNLFSSAIKLIFGWINFPDLPENLSFVFEYVFDLIGSSIGFVSAFIDLGFVRDMLPFVLVVVNFDKMYKLVMYVMRKIPFLGIK